MGKRETSRGFSVTQAVNQTVTNTTTETTIFSQTIPAGKMGTSKKLSLDILATLTTPAISIPSMTIKVKLGSSVLTVVSAIGLSISQTNSPFTIDATIRNRDANNSQIVYAKIMQVATSLPMLIANSSAVYADWTVDTSMDQTLSVTVQFGGISSGTSLVLRDVDLDLS